MLQNLIEPWSGEAYRHLPDGNYDVYDFRRQGKNKWHINQILIDDAPLSLDEAKEKIKEFSEQLKIPWQKKQKTIARCHQKTIT